MEGVSAPGTMEGSKPVKVVRFVDSSTDTSDSSGAPSAPKSEEPKQAEQAAPKPAKVKKNQPVPGVPHFSGKDEQSLTTFFRKVEDATVLGNWDNDYQRAQLSFLLEGKALEYIEGLPREDVETLDGLMTALSDRFLGPNAQKDARDGLRMMKRRAQENPQDYALRIQKLARIAYPGNLALQNEEGVVAYKHGMRDDKQVAEGLIMCKVKTVPECVEISCELERFRQQAGKQQPNLRLRAIEDEPEPAQSQPQGKKQGLNGQSSSGETDALRKELAQVSRDMSTFGRDLGWVKESCRRWEQLQEQIQQQLRMGQGPPPPPMGRPGPGQFPPGPGQGPPPNFPGGAGRGSGRGRGRRPFVEYPSADQPCRICKAPDHWGWRCPQKNQQAGAGTNRGPAAPQGNQEQGNAGGLDPRSGVQSGQKK